MKDTVCHSPEGNRELWKACKQESDTNLAFRSNHSDC